LSAFVRDGLLQKADHPDERRLAHVRFRHPEVGTDPSKLMQTVSDPDELREDERGGFHALKRTDKSHFLVVIYRVTEADRALIKTAFIINRKRKNRRYRA
jgi:hypothetical protein